MDGKIGKLIIDGSEYLTEIPEDAQRTFRGLPDPSEIRAFIPGIIVEVRVSEGDSVERGTVLLLLDAMKMHNEICTEFSGIVGKIHVSSGDNVKMNQLLLELNRK